MITAGRFAAFLFVVLLAWCTVNWVTAEKRCQQSEPPRHATLITAVAPQDWLPRGTAMCGR